MNEEELEAIRQKKMAQRQEQYQEQAAQAQKQQEMLRQLRDGAKLFLSREAQERLDTLRVSRPEKTAKAEAIIIRLAQNKQISREQPLSDDMLRDMLRKLDPQRETKIEFR